MQPVAIRSHNVSHDFQINTPVIGKMLTHNWGNQEAIKTKLRKSNSVWLLEKKIPKIWHNHESAQRRLSTKDRDWTRRALVREAPKRPFQYSRLFCVDSRYSISIKSISVPDWSNTTCGKVQRGKQFHKALKTKRDKGVQG